MTLETITQLILLSYILMLTIGINGIYEKEGFLPYLILPLVLNLIVIITFFANLFKICSKG